ncbi:MAG: alpha/beta hydrolase-fold protein [Ignavibacteriaceae bacterium]
MKTIVKLFVLIIILSFNILPQDDNKITVGDRITIKSDVLGAERQILISLPPGYNQGTAEYPVFYVLDGNVHFNYISGIVNYLAQNGKIPQMIVVGVVNINRTLDFTPTTSAEFQGTGGGEKFFPFITNELLPYIDNNYRTQPYRILFGHSLTGMYSIYTFLREPDLFNAFLAASPYVMYDKNYIVESAKTKLKDSYDSKRFLFITIGSREPEYFPALDELTGLFKSKSPDNFEWKYIREENGDHATTPVKTINEGLLALYSDWALPANFAAEGNLAKLKDHYKNLTDKYGYTIKAPEGLVNIVGYQVMGQGRIDDALDIFEYNVSQYPESVNVYDSYGEGLEAAGKLESAKENYEKAVKLGEEKNDPNLNIYKQHLEGVQKKMAAN